MAFKVRKAEVRKWPVTVMTRMGDDAGNVADLEQSFVAHWKPISEAEHELLLVELANAFGDPLPGADSAEAKRKVGELTQTQILERNAWYFARRLCGWGQEVSSEDGQPLPYSADTLKSLVTGEDGNAISAALLIADRQVRYGIAPAKNSATSPAPGETSGAGEAKTS